MDTRYTVVRTREGLQVSGFAPALTKEDWVVASASSQSLFLRRKDSGATWSDRSVTFCSTKLYAALIISLCQQRWSGTMTVDTPIGRKRLFLREGELVFASSELLDDRLGEVMFRSGLIDLETLASTATKVTRGLKFGQVLTQSGYLSSFQLWKALKEQVKHIVKSTFLFDTLHFELSPKLEEHSVVVFNAGSKALVDDCSGYGSLFRSFAKRITASSTVRVVRADGLREGSYWAELIRAMEGSPTVASFLQSSRLPREYSLCALMDLVDSGRCEVQLERDVLAAGLKTPQLEALRVVIGDYQRLLQAIKLAFEREGIAFPIASLMEMVSSFSHELPSFYLDAKGALSKQSELSILEQSTHIIGRTDYFKIRINSLLAFLYQLASDHLSDAVYRKLPMPSGQS